MPSNTGSPGTPSQVLIILLLLLLPRFGADAGYLPQISLALPSTIFGYGRPSTSPSLSSFIKFERPVAYRGVLENIGSSKAAAAEVSPGIVVASPSRSDPDYFYTWTRDSALTVKMLVDAFVAGDTFLQPTIEDYIAAQAQVQMVPNPSGDLSDGAGLGEPKFNVDETAFTGAWGRPQRDGPALRATALIAYSNWLLARGQNSTVVSTIWPIVANDLAYVGQYWNRTTFDLWEEVNGSSFFTTAVQYRALTEGTMLAEQIGKSWTAYISQSRQILCFMQSFWNRQYIVANINSDIGRTGKDANTLLASIHSFDPSAGCDDTTFQPCSPPALANHKAVTDSFRDIYTINSAIPKGEAIAIGRYSEDVYQGGNPWYLTTLAAAELLYAAHIQYSLLGSIIINPINHPFYLDLVPSITLGTYNTSSRTYETLLAALKIYADGFLGIVQKYTPPTGLLAEQFSRHDGSPVSAANLTWSYASFLTAISRREGRVPASWGALGSPLPSKCTPTSGKGSYAPPCATPTTVLVTFEVRKETVVGEIVYISGSLSEFGEWDLARAVEMGAEGYTAQEPVWRGVVTLRAGVKLEYKYVLKEIDGVVRWEGGSNRVMTVPGVCTGRAVVRDSWR